MNAVESTREYRPFFLGLWNETSSLALVSSEWIWLAAIYAVPFSVDHNVMPVLASFAVPGLFSYVLSKLLHHYMVSKTWLRAILMVWVAAALSTWLWRFVFVRGQLNLQSVVTKGFMPFVNSPDAQRLLLQIILFLLVIRTSLSIPAKIINSWQVVHSLQFGLLMFLIFGLTTAWGSFVTNLLPFGLYLFVILIALTAIRLGELGTSFGGKAPAFSRWWLISITLLALGLVFVSSISGWLVGVVLIEWANSILKFLYAILILYVMVVLYPLLFVLQAFMPVISKVITTLANSDLVQQQLDFVRSVLKIKFESKDTNPTFLNSGLTLTFAVIIVIIAIGLYFGFRLRQQRKDNRSEWEIEDLAEVQKMLKSNSQKRSLFESAVDQAKRWLAAARIRKIYALLMKICADMNHPRPSSFTPLEFQPQLEILFPELHAETKLITNTYSKVRYGEVPELLEEMQAVHEAWEKVKRDADAQIKLRRWKLIK